MLWFKKKKIDPSAVFTLQPGITVADQSRVEVELHKEASKEAKTEVDEANKKLNKLLVENGFTLKIYLAAGGQHPKKGH